MKKQREAKKPLSQREQVAENMNKSYRRCLTVARKLREEAARLISEAERNETKAQGFAQASATLRKGIEP